MSELNQYILGKAKENGICQEWADKIAVAASPDELMQMYVDGIDFCLSNNFPSNQDLQSLAGDVINRYGIYVDQAIRLEGRPFVVLLGSSSGVVKCNGFSATQIFVKHSSEVTIKVSDNAFAVIDCFDNTKTHIEVSGNAKACIHVYTGAKITTNQVDGKGMIKIIHKLKSTY